MSISGRSIRPTIFDVYADPTIVLPMVLANLMSPRLWDLSARAGDARDLGARLAAYQRVLDRYFLHLTPAQVAEADGTLHLDDIAGELGQDTFDRALEGIVSTMRWRLDRGTLNVGQELMALIDQGQFPNYVYGTIDELHAHRKLLGAKAKRPIGVTSCLDEAALFASLVATAPVDEIDGMILLGSAAHYTVLVWTGDPDGDDFEAWWLYGKNSLIGHVEYARIVADDYAGDFLLAFADRLPGADLIVSRRGTWHMATGRTALPAEERALTSKALDRFFCGRLAEVDEALTYAIEGHQPTQFDALFEACLNARGADDVQAIVRQSTNPHAREALMCFRDTESIPLEDYLPAARRGQRVHSALLSGAHADELLASIAGADPVLPGEGRVAMPEEVLAYGTAGALDRRLVDRLFAVN